MKKLKQLLVGLLALSVAMAASAQFAPGQILTAAQLNTAFANVLPIAGGTLTGPLTVPTLTATTALNTAHANITGGTISGLSSPLAVASGGTGGTASTGTGAVVLAGAPSIANLTVTSGFTATGLVGLPALAPQSANTVLANATASSASPTAMAVPGCSAATSALNWTSGTGIGCNSSINAATLNGATFAAPGNIGTGTPGVGAFTALSATAANPTLYYNQGGTGAVNRTYQQKFQNKLNVTDFGAVCNGSTDDRTAINNAVTALGAGGGIIEFPAGTCVVSGPINITSSSVFFAGQWTTLRSSSNSTAIINSTGSFFTLKGFYLGYAGTPTSGATAIFSSGGASSFSNFVVTSAYNGVEVTTGSSQLFSNFQINSYVNAGMYAHDVNDVFVSNFIINAGAATGSSGGFYLFNKVEAFIATTGDILGGVYSIQADASANTSGARPAYAKFTNVYFDSATQGSRLNNSVEFGFTNAWFSGGRSGGGLPGITLATTDSIRFDNTEFFSNGSYGALVTSGAVRTVFKNSTFESNSATSGVGVAHGLSIAAGTTDFIVEGCIAHNGLGAGQQGYGIFVNSGASNRYIITNNLVSGNQTGGVSDGGSGVNKNVSNNF